MAHRPTQWRTNRILREVIESHGMSTLAVANATGINRSTLTSWLLGKVHFDPRRPRAAEAIDKLIDYLELPVSIKEDIIQAVVEDRNAELGPYKEPTSSIPGLALAKSLLDQIEDHHTDAAVKRQAKLLILTWLEEIV